MPTLAELKASRGVAAGANYGFGGDAARTQVLSQIDKQIAGAQTEEDNSNLAKTQQDAMQRKLEEQQGLIAAQANKATPAPLALEAAPQTVGALPQYAAAREQAISRFNAQGQKQNDAINRKFAAMGQANSASNIKAQLQADNDVGAQREQAVQGINAEESGKQTEMNYNNQRDFMQRNLQRELSNQEGAFKGQDNSFRALVAGFDSSSKIAQLDAQYRDYLAGREDSSKSYDLYQQQLANSQKGGGFFDAIGGLVGAGAGAFTGGIGTGAAGALLGGKK